MFGACRSVLGALCCGCGGATPPRALGAAAPPAQVASSDGPAQKLDAALAKQFKPNEPGCAIGVYRAVQVLFTRGYGAANLEDDTPIRSDSVFEIASISKQFTAFMILLLERDGKLSLDDDVRKYVPELPDHARPIRLRHLLHHTSGLRDYVGLLALAGLEKERVTDDDMLLLLSRQKGLEFVPGSAWEYSNSGYFLLAVVAKRVSGMKFSEAPTRRPTAGWSGGRGAAIAGSSASTLSGAPSPPCWASTRCWAK